MKTNVSRAPFSTEDEKGLFKEYVETSFLSIFNKGTSNTLKEIERACKPEKIECFPITYVKYKVSYEKRDICESEKCSRYTDKVSDRMHYASEYNMWDFDFSDKDEKFANDQKEIIIKGSEYLNICNACSGSGNNACRCGSGFVVCPSCNGARYFVCPTCGGRTELECNRCNGTGNIRRSGIVGYENNDGHEVPIWGDYDETCSDCGGAGMVPCTNCYGGTITCNQCGGAGDITCPECNGSRFIKCSFCSGYGNFLYSVNILRKRSVSTITDILINTKLDKAIIDHLGSFKDLPEDCVLVSFSDDEFIDLVDIPDELKTLGFLQLNTKDTLNKMKNSLQSPAIRINSYGVDLVQKAYLKVFYKFNGELNVIYFDMSSSNYWLESNPYELILEQYAKRIQELYNSKIPKEIPNLIDEYNAIKNTMPDSKTTVQDPNIINNQIISDCKKACLIPGIIYIVFGIIYITNHFTLDLRFFIWIIAQVLVLEVVTKYSYLWRKIAGLGSNFMYGTFAVVTLVLELIVTKVVM